MECIRMEIRRHEEDSAVLSSFGTAGDDDIHDISMRSANIRKQLHRTRTRNRHLLPGDTLPASREVVESPAEKPHSIQYLNRSGCHHLYGGKLVIKTHTRSMAERFPMARFALVAVFVRLTHSLFRQSHGGSAVEHT